MSQNAAEYQDPYSLHTHLFTAPDDVLRAVIVAGCSHEIYHGVPKIEKDLPGFQDANKYLISLKKENSQKNKSKSLKQQKRELDAKVSFPISIYLAHTLYKNSSPPSFSRHRHRNLKLQWIRQSVQSRTFSAYFVR
jgi:hypothetical protein